MPFLNLSTGSFVYNQSYIYAAQPPYMTTLPVFIIFALLGVGLLLFSRHSQEPTCKDLSGIMATPILLISAIQAFNVDVLNDILVANGTTIFESHTVYHYDLLGVVLILFFIISCANLYLLWLDYNRVVPGEQPKISEEFGPKKHGKKPSYDEDDQE
jgi:hypothetical protein